VGSSLSIGSFYKIIEVIQKITLGAYQSGQMGQTVNLLGNLRWFESICPHYFKQAGVAQLVEHQPSKLRVAGSNLVACSDFEDLKEGAKVSPFFLALKYLRQESRLLVTSRCSSGVEHHLGKVGVGSSTLLVGSLKN
jgi:hypothetical protein